MLTENLFNSYLEYKKDTNSIASWLASTAKGHKQAKIKCVIRIRDFTTLAECILEKAIAVPLSFQSTLDRAIAARAGFRAKLERQGFRRDPIADAKHENFVEVLKHVRVILTSLMLSPDEDKSFDQGDALPNRFAGLAVDDPSEAFLSAPDIQRPTKPAADPVDYTAEIPASFEEALFALWTLMDDMNKARASIGSVWDSFKTGGLDMVPAAVTTNTVIELVRNMMEDVLPLVEMHGGLENCIERCYMIKCLLNTFPQSELTEVTFENAQDYYDLHFNIKDFVDFYDEANETFFTSFSLLQMIQPVLKVNAIPIFWDCLFGTFDANSDRTKKSGKDKFMDDGALLMPVLIDLTTIVLGVPDWPVHDELVRGMKEYLQNDRLPFYMVFAAQVFLDITYTLGPDIERVFPIFSRHTQFIINDLKMCFEYHEKLENQSCSPSTDQNLRHLRERMLWLSKDPVFQYQKQTLGLQGVPANQENSHRIFRMSPVFCGLILYQARYNYREYGIGVANEWGSIQFIGHLYNVLQINGLLVDRWEDMDFVKAFLGTESFYLGGQEPRTVSDALKKYCLQMGISATAYIEKSRAKRAFQSTDKARALMTKTGPRGLRVTAPVATMFKERLGFNQNIVLTSEQVDRIIQLSTFELELGGETGHAVLGRIGDEKKLKEKQKLRHDIEAGLKPSSRPSASKTRISLGQLTERLASTLQAEMREFSFPYMTMHRWCWRLFRAVRDECDLEFTRIFGLDYFEHKGELSSLPGLIFMLGCGEGGHVTNTGPMVAASEVLNRMLSAGTGSIIGNILKDTLGLPDEFVEERDEEEENAE